VLSRDAGIGKSAIMRSQMAVSQHFMAWLCGSKLNNHFLYYWLQFAKPQFEQVANGTTIKTIGLQYFKDLEIPLPPMHEQRAIAKALFDIDLLLSGLDRLIAKKGDLKQAVLQQLLTGQSRLQGFKDSWDVKRLAEIFTIFAGKSKSAYLIEGGDYWVCDMGSVSVEGRLIVSKRTNFRGDFLKRGDLIMPKDDIGGGNIIGKVGYIDANNAYILGDHVYCLRAVDGDPRFLAYAINSYQVNSELRKKVIGSAQLGLGRKSVNEQEIRVPKTPEQTAIADVLSEIDLELLGLEQRREKTSLIKRAMMQQLLTGKVRLI
jgi:type I restriction enzyme S subunit